MHANRAHLVLLTSVTVIVILMSAPRVASAYEQWSIVDNATTASPQCRRSGGPDFDCHQRDPLPPGEDVAPSYYFTPDAAHLDKPTDPCNPAPNLPEHFAGLTLGMDNDGDLAYDGVDADCGGLLQDGFESGDTSAWALTVP